MINPELVTLRRIVAAISALSAEARAAPADLPLDVVHDGRKRMAVIGVALQRFGVRDDLGALRMALPWKWTKSATRSDIALVRNYFAF